VARRCSAPGPGWCWPRRCWPRRSHRCWEPFAPLQFAHDFIVFAYTLGLARLFLMLSALDVGSSFEGMGSAREASFTTFIEPALFLLAGTALSAPARPALPA
jgi:hypothetical protein